MWRAVGLFRDRAGLTEAVTVLDRAAASTYAPTPDGWRLKNLVTVARLIAGAALRREESRGAHFRADFPERDDIHWRVHVTDRQSRG
jgi:succinate dehydrogenase/fumarate reductase flavoprotein subunit